jgi:6-pyruvoyltetrahydropterin/6-carboxytetrahydropterin synthase
MTITRRFEFDYGHRVLGHEGKCRFVHGHRGVVEVTLDAPQLDSLGRVMDFGKVKEVIGSWIDEFLDHNLILNPDDPIAHLDKDDPILGGKEPYLMYKGLMLKGWNPTAENLAIEIFHVVEKLLLQISNDVRVVAVRFWETPNSSATYKPTDIFSMP